MSLIDLFSPLKLGAITLPNRVIMAPLTRGRSGTERIPNELMREYYVQRASAGLIITEATSVCPMGVGYADTPGIWNDAQVEGWKQITDAVHDAGGRIVMQLWHVGRISDPMFLDGELPVAPSAIAAEGHVSLVRPIKPYVTPRALETDEIPGIIEAYRHGAENAKRAGFDGVEIHGANGYLLDQFLQDSTNKRTDAYGGSLENRARLMLEVTDAVVSVWGAERVGMHLAPQGDSHDMGDSDLKATFTYVAQQLNQRGIAFICTREARRDETRDTPTTPWLTLSLREAFDGVLIANEGFSQESADEVIAQGQADAVAFGKLYIANPDLVERFKTHAPLNTPNPETFYGGTPQGYTDYPTRHALVGAQ